MFSRAPSPIPPRLVRLSVSGISETAKPSLEQRAHGQADAVERDRALLDQIALELRLDLDLEHAREALVADRAHGARAVDVALHDVPAQALVRRAAAARG